MYDKNNIFAKIIRKEISSKPIYEDEKVLFINDLYPQAKIHILGMPKIYVVDFNDFILKASDEQVSYFFFKTHEVIKDVGLESKGFRMITNSGHYGGQEIPHFHIHIMGGENLGEKK